MRPTDFCTPKPFQLEHSCFASSQRGSLGFSRDVFRRPVETARPPSSRALRLVPSRATVFFARCFARPKTAERGTGWLGPPDARRGWGESRFTTRIPLRRAMGERAEAYCSSARHRTRHLWHPCRLLRARVEGRSHDSLAFARRPPRPVPRGPREGRALPRSKVPSVGSRHAHPAAPKRGRNHAAFFDRPALT